MSENTENKMLNCLYGGDPRVRVLLGRQKPPKEGERIRKSCFVYSMYMDRRYILFHTLTREIIILSPQLIDYFADDRFFPASILEQEIPAKLYEEHFLIPEHVSESQLYLELKDIIVLKEELPRYITHYVILPTTVCNARCFYCFEQGMKYHTMDEETIEDTLRFIKQHKSKDDKPIHIHWFGGEPMCAVKNIDRICAGLIESGIAYDAEMTSNGSLFTEETVKKAAEIWKVSKVQITLDGMAEEYSKRKRYADSFVKPFETVIKNMHLLIAAGIKITIRLNVDENNIGETFRVVDFLKEEFSSEEQEKMRVYAHSIFSQPGDGLNACPAYTGSDELEARVMEINDYIRIKGLAQHDLGTLFNFKSHYCMVTAPECNALIDAAGQLFACEGMPENMKYGNVKTGIDPDAWKQVTAPCKVREECAYCVFLPQCTEFDRCPDRIAYDNCYKQENRKLKNELHFAYGLYLEKQRQKHQEQDTAEQREADSVSD